MNSPRQNYRTYAERILLVIGIAGTIAIVSLTLWSAAHVFLLLFAGILLAIMFRSLADPLAHYARLPPGVALAAVMLVLFGAGAAILWSYGGQIVQGIYDLVRTLPEALRSARAQLQQHTWGQNLLQALADVQWMNVTQDVVRRVVGVFYTIVPAVASLLIILFLGVYLSVEPRLYSDGLLQLVPPSRRERARQVLQQLARVLKWFLAGRALSMILLFGLTWIGLILLGVPQALPLALLAGLLEFIPNIGPILSAVPAVAVAFAQAPILALWVVLLYTGLQTVESYLITPIIQREMVSIPPALLFVVQLLLGYFFGLLGLILAAPLTAVLMVLVQMLYVQDVLGDRA